MAKAYEAWAKRCMAPTTPGRSSRRRDSKHHIQSFYQSVTKKTILTTVAALSMLCTFAQWKPVGDKIKDAMGRKVDLANVPLNTRVRRWYARSG